MKFKPTPSSGGLIVELRQNEEQLPSTLPSPTPEPQPFFRLKQILVPVDFSDCSQKALLYALPLARQFAARITLLHVVPQPPPTPGLGPVDAAGLDSAAKQIKQLQTLLGPAIASNGLVRSGEPHREIVTTAKRIGADLILLSTHGRTGLARMLMGSTTEKVVRHAGCPVLIVRQRERDFISQTPQKAQTLPPPLG